jgi:flagellar hook-associated protein 2
MGTRIGAITFGGISSGLPTDEIIGKLLELSRRPIQVLEKQRDDQAERLELYQELNSKTAALRDALRGLDNMADVVRRADPETGVVPAPLPSAFEEFRAYRAISSDETKAVATAGRSATPGSLVFSIEQLARQHRSLSDPYTSAGQVIAPGGGTLGIQIGTGAPSSIAIAAGATVQQVVDAVNAAGIDATAFVVDTGQGAVRIAIVGDKSGADQSLAISNDFGQTFTTTQTAQNARIVLDPGSALPVAIESSTNSFENVIQGLTLDVKATATAAEPVTVTVDASTETMKEDLAKLVQAYNAIVDVIRQQNSVDPTTNRGGPLLGDSTMVSLGQRLAASLARSYGSGSVVMTRQLGIELGNDGRLSLDEDVLEAALAADFEGVASFFAGTDSFADEFREVVDSFVDPIGGTLTARISGTTERIADLRENIARAEERLDTFESNLVQQFAALERTLSQFQEQSSFLASFLLGGQSR